MFHSAGANVIPIPWTRRECAACAEGKKECDLQRPCSACKAENRECTSPPSNRVQRPTIHDQENSASGPSPVNDSADGTAANSASEVSSSSSCSYLEIHPYSLVSRAMVASWPPYVYIPAPEDSIGDEAEKYQAPTEWTSPTEAQYLRYST